jgi:hypothetical protein
VLIGAGVYAEVYPYLADTLLRAGSYGKLTLPGLIGVNHWAVIVPLVVVLGAFLFWLDRREAGTARVAPGRRATAGR